MLRECLVGFLLLLEATFAPAQSETPSGEVPVPSDQWAAQHISRPELISGDRPDYPVEAAFQRLDGQCLIAFVVSAQGVPEKVRSVHCTDSSFEESSLDAVKQYLFKPATTQEGKPVPVAVSGTLQYHSVKYFLSLHMLIDWPIVPDKHLSLDRRMSKADVNRAVGEPIRHVFIPQQGGASIPDSDGVYPLTRSVTGPRVIKFSDRGYGRLAFVREGTSTCDIVLTIDTKGKASDPQVTHCERPELEKPAIESLLKSDYKPGMVKGKEVPMRASIHLNYGEPASTD